MSCQETKVFIDAYSDGELDLVRSIELERHLNVCSGCAAMHELRRTMRSAVRADALRYLPADALKKRVGAAVAARSRKERRMNRSWISLPWPIAISTVAATLVAAALLWLRPADNPVEREVIDSHVRSLMAGHLTDVPSTDRHTVKPWFAGKLDFSPPVRDFAAEGFPLVGGRLDYVDHHAAAAIVYRRNQHLINVLLWPVREPDRGLRSISEQGYEAVGTVHGGMEIWAVSDLNIDELDRFAKMFVSPAAQ